MAISDPTMEYLYTFANASLTLRLVEYLYNHPDLDFVSVIHHIDRWFVRVKLKSPLNLQQGGDFRAILNELGFPAAPPRLIILALQSLEAGYSCVEVMRRYQVVIISHGKPKREEIEIFRRQFIQGLGYCPQHLA